MIYVISHKKIDNVLPKNYYYLQVGAYNKAKFTDITDDTMDNISKKNASFCELTGIYWLWKNSKDQYIGITHYRRFLYFKNEIISYDKIIDLLKDYDVILPKKYYSKRTNYEHYICSKKGCGYEKDLLILKDVIREKFPEYLNCYENYIQKKNSYYLNIMFCKKELFDSYCEWLFNILFEVEKRIDVTNYDNYKKRIYGFMSERLLNVWVKKNNLKIKELHVFDYKINNLIYLLKKGKYYLRKFFLR